MSDYFVMVPEAVLYSDISNSAFRVWAILKNQAEGFHPGLSLLVSKAGMTRQTVLTALQELEGFGLVKVTRKKGVRNVYEVLDEASTSLKIRPDQSKNHTTTNTNTKTKTKTNTNTNPESVPSPAKLSPPPKKKKPAKKTEPKYEAQDMDFANEWIEWLSDRGSHHAKSAKKPSYATALAKLRTKYGLDKGKLPEMKKLVLENEFWANNMISPNGLLKTWSNGNVACLALLDELDKVHKKKAPSLGLFDKEIAEIKRREKMNMQNVTPIRPLMIGS